ncbi:hypothetical protein [Mangrovibacterium sp.]|uniref:hypothetical protein n=1 Tax=Mangrovibacterium sp. TaxID=1961364 RepID=UPI0035657177
MKKVLLSLCLLAIVAITSTAFGQSHTDPKIETVNAVKTYTVDSHANSVYAWSIYSWTPSDDFTADAWTKSAADASAYTKTDATNSTEIKWLTPGSYVVEVVESNGASGCTTIRRFGVTIIDLDLLVVTKYGATTITGTGNDNEMCNTDEGNIYGELDADNLNDGSSTVDPALGTMTFTYEITLFADKAGVSGEELAAILPTALWKFDLANTVVLPTSQNSSATNVASITWAIEAGSVTDGVTAANTSFTTEGTGTINVPADVKTVTITATIQNVADVLDQNYVINMSVDPSTVLVENSAIHNGDYAEGQEDADYNGIADAASHTNSAVQITVKPIPNTSKITVD